MKDFTLEIYISQKTGKIRGRVKGREDVMMDMTKLGRFLIM